MPGYLSYVLCLCRIWTRKPYTNNRLPSNDVVKVKYLLFVVLIFYLRTLKST